MELNNNYHNRNDKSKNRNENPNQKSLKLYLRNKSEMEIEMDTVNKYYIPCLMNQMNILELNELTHKQGFNRLISNDIYNINYNIISRTQCYNIFKFYDMPFKHRLKSSIETQGYNNVTQMDYISDIKFDKMGSLFCVLSTSGNVQIFDFDEIITKYNRARIKWDNALCNDLNQKNKKIHIERQKCLEFDTQFRSETLKWKNDDEIIIGGHIGGTILVYNIEKNKKSKKYNTPKEYKHCITNMFLDGYNNLYAGDKQGNVWFWDLRQNNKIPLKHYSYPKNYIGFSTNNNKKMCHLGRNFNIKNIHVNNDGRWMTLIRQNGYIENMDTRFNTRVVRTVDIWRCNNINNDNNSTNYMDYNYRAFVDDGYYISSTDSAILRLQNSNLVHLNLQTKSIIKTYQMKYNENVKIDTNYLSKIMQRRICNLNNYGYIDIVLNPSLSNDLMLIDMNNELDIYKHEQQYRETKNEFNKTFNHNHNPNNSDKYYNTRISFLKNEYHTNLFNNTSYGLIDDINVSNAITSMDINPNLMYIICGTFANEIQIIGIGSSPQNDIEIIQKQQIMNQKNAQQSQ